MRAVRVTIVSISVIALLVGAQARSLKSAYACSCGFTTDWTLRLQHFGAIFAGEVTNVHDTNSKEFLASQVITFKVYAAWKGISTPHITIYSDRGWPGGCGVGFEVGERWLISTSGDGGSVGSCDLPMILEQAGDDLAALGTPSYGSLPALYVPSTGRLPTTGKPITSDLAVDGPQHTVDIATMVIALVVAIFVFLLKTRSPRIRM